MKYFALNSGARSGVAGAAFVDRLSDWMKEETAMKTVARTERKRSLRIECSDVSIAKIRISSYFFPGKKVRRPSGPIAVFEQPAVSGRSAERVIPAAAGSNDKRFR